MSKAGFVYVCGVSAVVLLSAWQVNAQVFSDEAAEVDEVKSASTSSAADWKSFYKKSSENKVNKFGGMVAPKTEGVKASDNKTKDKPLEDEGKSETSKLDKKEGTGSQFKKQEVENPEDYIYKNVPQIDRPTLDGVKRGRTSIISVTPDKKVQTEGYIYLYYSDFEIGNMMSGTTTCNVKFQILTTLDRRLNALSFRLKWPELETPVSFIDVNPNQPYHMYYTLLGDGCYTMDKVPNIVINRCRVKGMKQEECAKKIRWIRKSL